jgi:hypothetical protein
MQRCFFISILVSLLAAALCTTTSPSSPYIDLTSDSINGAGIGFAFSSSDSMCSSPLPLPYNTFVHITALQRQVISIRPSLAAGSYLQIRIVGRSLLLCLRLQVTLLGQR